MTTLRLFVATLSILAASSTVSISQECLVPTSPGVQFLPKTSDPKNLMPLPDPLPDPGKEVLPADCPFYQGAWQKFLFVTQSLAGRGPRFLNYPTFEAVFKIKASPLFAEEQMGLLSLAPRNIQHPNNDPRDITINDVEQAGLQDVLIDQNGNVVWYAIHVNDEFVHFLHDYNLTDTKVLDKIPANLELRPGILELKSAWQIVEGPIPSNYITTRAVVPIFKHDTSGKIVRDGNRTRDVTVALLSLHVVGVIEGHPELIWATFEHISHERDGTWLRDVAPSAKCYPDDPAVGCKPVNVVTKAAKYSLYPVDPRQNSAPPVPTANAGNKLNDLKLDEGAQKFSPVTPVYRVFPGSKPDDTKEDEEVTGLNESVKELFEKLHIVERDVRSNYQLVGAVWLNRPRVVDSQANQAGAIFRPNRNFPDADNELFGGESALSNMALESFTQSRNPHCFSCHDTSRVKRIHGSVDLPASELNVSHLLSKYYDLSK